MIFQYLWMIPYGIWQILKYIFLGLILFAPIYNIYSAVKDVIYGIKNRKGISMHSGMILFCALVLTFIASYMCYAGYMTEIISCPLKNNLKALIIFFTAWGIAKNLSFGLVCSSVDDIDEDFDWRCEKSVGISFLIRILKTADVVLDKLYKRRDKSGVSKKKIYFLHHSNNESEEIVINEGKQHHAVCETKGSDEYR